MKEGKSDELYVYKYYLDRGHTFEEMNNWSYNEYTIALAFMLLEVSNN